MAFEKNRACLSAVARSLARKVVRSPGFAAMFDRGMRYLAASRRWREEVHPGHGMLVGRLHAEIARRIPDPWRQSFPQALAGETALCGDDATAGDDRDAASGSWSVEPWTEPDGTIGGIIVTRSTPRESRETPEEEGPVPVQLEELFAQRAVAILVTDPSGRVLRASRLYLELMRSRGEEVLGGVFHARVHEADRRGLLCEFERLCTGGCRSLEGRHRQLRADGSIVWMEHSITILSAPREAPRIVFFLSDATARIELEQRVRELDRLASIGLLGATLGHDMTNALLPIRANLNAIRVLVPAHAKGPTLTGSLQAVEQGVAYLQHLADGTHSLADGMTQAFEDHPSTDLRDWWGAVEPVMRAAAPGGVRLESAFADGLPAVAMPPHDLTRSVLNLVANARKAIQCRTGARTRGGRIAIACEPCVHRRRPAALVSIRDNGVGMPASVQEQVGKPLFTTRLDGSGTGLGLYSVRQTVERVGGELRIDSTIDVGTTVTLLIPGC